MRTFHYFLFFLSLALLSGIASAQTPLAAFGGTPVSGASPLTVTFTDSSTGSPTGWAWYFGDENFAGFMDTADRECRLEPDQSEQCGHAGRKYCNNRWL